MSSKVEEISDQCAGSEKTSEMTPANLVMPEVSYRASDSL